MFRIHLRKGECFTFFGLYFRKTNLFRITYWKLETDRWRLPKVERCKYSGGNGLFLTLGKLWVYRKL